MAASAQAPYESARKRAAKAWGKHAEWDKVLADAYDYVAPHRRSTRLGKRAASAHVDRIFDPHGANALHRVVGRLMEDLFPSGEKLIELEPGPGVNEKDVDAARDELAALSDTIAPVFWQGDFDGAAHGMVTDAMISTGYMLMLAGDRAHPVRWINIPQDELAVDAGPYGETHGFFWKRKWTRRAVLEAWPKGRFDEKFRQMAEADGEGEVTICQDHIFVTEGKWKTCVYVEGSKGDNIVEEMFKACRIVAFKYFQLPGEVNGFGPVLMNMPMIKTLNKVQELALKGTALNALGLFTMIDDGVFNPDTARLSPGAFWKVARNGGPLGPSISRLPTGTDPNLTMLAVQDMRMSISAGMNDQELPPDGQSPRSAAEIIERSRRLRKNHAGAFARIVHDVFMKMLPAVMEILSELGVLDAPVKVDQLYVRMKVLSPLGAAFRARKAENYVDWAQVTLGLGGPEALRMVSPLEPALARLGYDMGVDPRLVNSPSEQQVLAQRVQEGVASAMEAMKQAGQSALGSGQSPPPANGDPAQGLAA